MASSSRKTWTVRWRWLVPVAALVAAFHFSSFGSALDWGFFDTASRHPLRQPPLPTNSVLVMIDENTMEAMSKLGVRWPFRRAIFAQLIAALHQSGATRIILDSTFFEESIAPAEDLLLASVAAAAPTVVLARSKERAPIFWSGEYIAAHPSFFARPRTGLTDLGGPRDTVTRVYAVPGSLAAAAFDPPATVAGGLLRWHGGLKDLGAKGVSVISAAPIILTGRPILERLVAAAPDLQPEQIAEALAKEPAVANTSADLVRGRVVFIGSNASGTFDFKQMPVGEVESGLLLHWTAWTNLATSGFITAVPRTGIMLGALFVAGAVVWAGRNRLALAAPVAMAGILGGFCLLGSYAALSAGWFFPPATPMAAIVLTLLGVVAESFWTEQARKREIQGMFGAYVDPGVVAQLVRNPDSINLGGESREATVFFSDLVGFTDLSEKLKDKPEQMVEVVNAYLEETSECLHQYGAYVDKYIGDAVMAVFGVPKDLPDHELAACHAALAARRALDGVNARYAESVGVRLAVRIGLNSGRMIVGNLGSSRKKNYTVMGDAVNLASRLEGANKEFGTHILLGETTARAVAGRMATRPLTRLRVKGKKEAIEVSELIGTPDSLDPAQRDFLAAYLPGYAHFTARRFAEAAADFDRALVTRPDDDVTRELLEQAAAFASNPPPADWEPILTLKSK